MDVGRKLELSESRRVLVRSAGDVVGAGSDDDARAGVGRREKHGHVGVLLPLRAAPAQ